MPLSTQSSDSLSSAGRQSFGVNSVSDFLAQFPIPTNLPSNKWQDIPVTFLHDNEIALIDPETSMEEASSILIDRDLSALPIVAAKGSNEIATTFDYADLNSFLLMVVGFDDFNDGRFKKVAEDIRAGKVITAYEVAKLGKNKDDFITIPHTTSLGRLAEILSSGIRRVAVTNEQGELSFMASQRSIIRFLWNNIRAFPDLEPLMSRTIHSLDIGSTDITCISGDQKVAAALRQMNQTGIGSLAVVDAQFRLLGNISLVDVKYVTRSSSVYLLNKSCAHFLSVIKSEQGIRAGKDSAPAFNIYESSTFAFTLAKLVATQCHRLWLVQSPSCPPSPKNNAHLSPGSMGGVKVNQLLGVVSLTDIISVLYAHMKGTLPPAPHSAPSLRHGRRGSTSSHRSHSKASVDTQRR
ncbi:Protein sds23/moc1 [Schizosaccharomyces pombe]|uniref:Protein sds23/moc1 n=1 Tax=Schizosaccharomyces pombe (strain 972 / ATCC 24843) TaxID=284812 RepID=SDS23_SCHPO|nr:protein sds23 [Schizosaccharomyces pombe]Q09826.1 RecName: Full=Protein sds23/moc1; AltName: Full=Multicopy suppressor of overexpressed cyr1 protein 1; AltName: Full=Phosphoprotein at stationary phase 1 protein [Schizosaccharomyces pombe 972h-]BAA13172.1 Sds23 [Schizosaccharomyces pombe]BAA13486.1 MOC1 [Schizosaccharomyces pombe]CAA22817.1 inducer of sexual development Sds23/Moc1 [Schizosaccharomyces pombe]|eukprot:NP_001342790.1 protein sds23 [Schizosaccharomyces pombe]